VIDKFPRITPPPAEAPLPVTRPYP
jgi:hypothetical protein